MLPAALYYHQHNYHGHVIWKIFHTFFMDIFLTDRNKNANEIIKSTLPLKKKNLIINSLFFIDNIFFQSKC